MSGVHLEATYDLECAHRLLGYHGKCARLHGHNYRVILTLARGPDDLEQGMVMDTANLDACVRPVFAEMDHRTLLEESDPLVAILRADGDHVYALPYSPTAENIAKHIHWRLGFLSRSGRQVLARVRVEENPKVAAEFPG
jgi:6-pyruvoyltetrahydropterin/6-carboxytetrahydropterin synthase